MNPTERAESTRTQALLTSDMLRLFHRATDRDRAVRRITRNGVGRRMFQEALALGKCERMKQLFQRYMTQEWLPRRGTLSLNRQLKAVVDIFGQYPVFCFAYNVFLPIEFDLVSGYSNSTPGYSIRNLNSTKMALFIDLPTGDMVYNDALQPRGVEDFVEQAHTISIVRHYTPGHGNFGPNDVIRTIENEERLSSEPFRNYIHTPTAPD